MNELLYTLKRKGEFLSMKTSTNIQVDDGGKRVPVGSNIARCLIDSCMSLDRK